jgi:3-hydroxybutyryl-CoA dehydrogenase
MGNGIAQVMASSGLDVVMMDLAQDAIERGLATIRNSLSKLVEKEKITAVERDAALARIQTVNSLEALAEVDVVIEAATENEALKLRIFSDLDRICAPSATLATNTSSISVTRIAAGTQRPDQVIGMHFFNPVPLMQLVEIIRALQTSEDTYRRIEDLARTVGKHPIEARDSFGFVANRILMPMINEAVFVLQEGLTTAEDIDTAMKLGMNHPMGPLALADLIGLDTCLSVMQVLYEGFNDSKYRPCPLLKQMVDAGYLGRKSGRGFHSYS